MTVSIIIDGIQLNNIILRKAQHSKLIFISATTSEDRAVTVGTIDFKKHRLNHLSTTGEGLWKNKYYALIEKEIRKMEGEKVTAQEVPVQEQLLKLLEGMTLSQWEQIKICIDREFKSQANKVIFESRDSFKQLLDLEITRK